MPPPVAPGTPHRVASRIVVAALLAFVVTGAALPLDNNDVWIHLTTGGLVLDEGAVPTTDRYSFTGEGQRYVAHEWLAATLYAVGWRAGGERGVLFVGKMVPALATAAALFAVLAVCGAPRGLTLPISVLSLTLLRRRLIARPELLALPLVLLALWLLWRDRNAARAGHRTRAIYWLIPIEWVWANLHGSFPIGIVLVAVFAAAEAAEHLLGRRDRRAAVTRTVVCLGAACAAAFIATLEPSSFGLPAAALVAGAALLLAADGVRPIFAVRDGTGSQGVLRLTGIALAMLLAAAVNPIGFELFAFPFEFTAGESFVTEFVHEWQPIFAAEYLRESIYLSTYAVFAAVALAALGMAARRGRAGFLEFGLLAAVFLLPLRHSRWLALTALAAAPAVASSLWAARNSSPARDVPRALVAGALTAGSLGLFWLALRMFEPLAGEAAMTLAIGLAISPPLVALALAARPAAPLGWGIAAAGASALALVALASVSGFPDFEKTQPQPWMRAEPRGPALQARDATRFLRREAIPGRLFTEYVWAGYAIHELWPDVQVFLDSRSEVHGPERLNVYLNTKRYTEVALETLERHGIDLIVVRNLPYPAMRKTNLGLLPAVENDPAWALLYVDDRAIVYARKLPNRRLPPALDFDPHRFQPGDGSHASPAFTRDLRLAVQRAPDSAFLRFALADSLLARGRPAAALTELERGYATNPRYAGVPQLAGDIAAAARDTDAAAVWYERALEIAPEWERPRRALEALERQRERSDAVLQ